MRLGLVLAAAAALAPRPARAVEAPAPAPSPAPAHTLMGPDTLLRFDRAGNLVGVEVRRYDEEILACRYVPEKVWSAQTYGQPPPVPFVAGLFLSQVRTGPTSGPSSPLEAVARIGQDSAVFRLADPRGRVLPPALVVTREYRPRSPFRIEMTLTIENASNAPFRTTTQTGIALTLGPIVPPQEDFPEAIYGKGDGVLALTPKPELTPVGPGPTWVGVRSKYFAWLLDARTHPGTYLASAPAIVDERGKAKNSMLVSYRPQLDLPPGKAATLPLTLYIGLKVPQDLGQGYQSVFNNWDVWYGQIGQAMFALLAWFQVVTRSYGLSIILLTLLVKVLLHPLSVAQTRSMFRMQELKPKIDELKSRYKDAQQLNQEMMRLYKEHNVNPLGGCFPILLQIPIFIALYSCLSSAIELKGVPYLWLPDLSRPDPTEVLPILFCLTMYISSKAMQQAQPTTDQATASMMNRTMPILMFFLMRTVPSGVMLYLSGQTVLSIIEQKVTMSRLRRESPSEASRKTPRVARRQAGAALPGA